MTSFSIKSLIYAIKDFACDKKRRQRFLWEDVLNWNFQQRKRTKKAEKTYCKCRNAVEKVIECETDNVNFTSATSVWLLKFN